ncbi:hypothetical protein EJ04DRAFT_571734 [Polyplosphaeria fusca]|uniref:Uncharacterized protein n=1 Tax=Polyplosphaeria fusca TaxID=682080 RepID=A0A9P4V5T1_9PLEO|nr:hypothetical protein EJ04DRAFT_571734 [Polyplosphaeria fusca]
MDSSPDAAQRVFSLPELLEPILFYAGVAKYGSNTRKTSKENANRMAEAKDFQRSQDAAAGMRFLLCSAKRVNSQWNAVIESSSMIQEALFLKWDKRNAAMFSRFNPLLVSTFTWGYFHDGTFPKEINREALACEGASWRRMYPVFPPVDTFETWETHMTGYWDYDTKGVIPEKLFEADGGLRMGLLFDLAEEWKDNTRESGFRVRWSGKIDLNDPAMLEQLDEREIEYAGYQPDQATQVAYFSDPITWFIDQSRLIERAHTTVALVDRARLTMEKTDRSPNLFRNAYAKLASNGKQWSLKDIERGESWRSK